MSMNKSWACTVVQISTGIRYTQVSKRNESSWPSNCNSFHSHHLALVILCKILSSSGTTLAGASRFIGRQCCGILNGADVCLVDLRLQCQQFWPTIIYDARWLKRKRFGKRDSYRWKKTGANLDTPWNGRRQRSTLLSMTSLVVRNFFSFCFELLIFLQDDAHGSIKKNMRIHFSKKQLHCKLSCVFLGEMQKKQLKKIMDPSGFTDLEIWLLADICHSVASNPGPYHFAAARPLCDGRRSGADERLGSRLRYTAVDHWSVWRRALCPSYDNTSNFPDH